jgi:hypothetical protein
MPAPQTGQTPRAMGRPLALVVYVTRCIGWCSRQRAHHPISSPLRVSCASASESSDAAAGVGCSAAPMSPFAVGGVTSSGDPGAPGVTGGNAAAGAGCAAVSSSPFGSGGVVSPGNAGAPGAAGGAAAGAGCAAVSSSPFGSGGRCFTWGRRRTGRGGRRYGGRGWMRRGGWRQGRSDGRRCCAARCDQRLPSPGDFPPHQPQDRHNCRQAQQTPDG